MSFLKWLISFLFGESTVQTEQTSAEVRGEPEAAQNEQPTPVRKGMFSIEVVHVYCGSSTLWDKVLFAISSALQMDNLEFNSALKKKTPIFIIVHGREVATHPEVWYELVRVCDAYKIGIMIEGHADLALTFLAGMYHKNAGVSIESATHLVAQLFPEGDFIHNPPTEVSEST